MHQINDLWTTCPWFGPWNVAHGVHTGVERILADNDVVFSGRFQHAATVTVHLRQVHPRVLTRVWNPPPRPWMHPEYPTSLSLATPHLEYALTLHPTRLPFTIDTPTTK